jgi:hypothetical protein
LTRKELRPGNRKTKKKPKESQLGIIPVGLRDPNEQSKFRIIRSICWTNFQICASTFDKRLFWVIFGVEKNSLNLL